MRGPWLETQPDKYTGMRCWEIEVADNYAFLLVMLVLHHQASLLPYSIGIEPLARIAVVVDDLGCHDAMQSDARHWLDWTKFTWKKNIYLNGRDYRDFVLEILVAQVFQVPQLFEPAARNILENLDAKFDTLNLPIGSGIVDAINEAREAGINSIIEIVSQCIKKLQSGEGSSIGMGCSKECQAILLGAMMTQLPEKFMQASILHPLPFPIPDDFSINSLKEFINDLHPLLWCEVAKGKPKQRDNKKYDEEQFKKRIKATYKRNSEGERRYDPGNPYSSRRCREHACDFYQLKQGVAEQTRAWTCLPLEKSMGYVQYAGLYR
ncbi:hypothetical protein F5Y16DRAFT_415484 [Xylariaceae sp. FL0255]|nr:hypothetical protein F5Y16DRAFT_415484 [Xylariaceae sp. FL0255]